MTTKEEGTDSGAETEGRRRQRHRQFNKNNYFLGTKYYVKCIIIRTKVFSKLKITLKRKANQ